MAQRSSHWIPRSARDDKSRAAFTLIETLLVLALLALIAGVLVPPAAGLLRRGGGSLDDQVADIMQEARRDAVLGGHEVVMHFDEKAQRFTWERDGTARRLPLEGPRMAVDFLRPTGGGAVLLGGRAVETGAVPALTFFPDGTCDPVRLQFRPENGDARVVSIDPWTCAPGLEVKP